MPRAPQYDVEGQEAATVTVEEALPGTAATADSFQVCRQPSSSLRFSLY